MRLRELSNVFGSYLFLLFLADAAVAAPKPPPAPAVTWQPPSLTLAVTQGGTGAADVTLNVNQSLKDVRLIFSAGLRTWFSASPNSFARLPAGTNQTITLTVAVPLNTTPNTYPGTLEVWSGRKTLQQSLPIALNVLKANSPPVAVADSYSTDEDAPLGVSAPGVLDNDTDADGNPLTAVLVSGPSHAVGFALNANGSFSYTPSPNYNGTDSFSYKANDGNADSGPVTVTVSVNAVNDPPVANDDTAFTLVGTAINIDVLANDTDADDDELTITGLTQPEHGDAVEDGGLVVYTPAAGFSGMDEFQYSIADGNGGIAMSTVRVVGVSFPLNDTGITWGGGYPRSNHTFCTSNGTIAAPQDCDQGRDATHNDDSDGHAGFSFTKIGADGTPLAIQNGTWDEAGSEAAGTKWSCVRDNVTGRIWEVKTSDGGLQDVHWSYTSYDSAYADAGDNATNGGPDGAWAGPVDTGVGSYSDNCSNQDKICTTEQYVKDANDAGLCGGLDWRMPTIKEIDSILDFGRQVFGPDPEYFPNLINMNVFASNQPDVYLPSAIWVHLPGGASTGASFRHHPIRFLIVREAPE